MQRMWENIHQERRFKETRAHSHRREALQLRRVREIFLRSESSHSSSAGPLGREELRVWKMWKEIYDEFRFEASPAHSHGRKTLPVSSLSQEIQPEFELEGPHPEKAPGPIRVRTNIRMHRMSGEICDETRIGETCASRSFVVSSIQRGIGGGGFRRNRPEAEREIGCHRCAPENRRSVNRIYGFWANVHLQY